MVILIHGTFARDASWTRPGSTLRTHIERDAPGALTFYQFQWSGKNTHRARLEAGRCFATYLRDVKARHADARIVAITHSHGGNIVLYAANHLEIDRYLDGMVSLGTPFLHVRPRNIRQYTRTLDLCLHTIHFVLWLLTFTTIVYLLSAYTFAWPIPAMPDWLAATWSPSSISPGLRWFVFAPLLVLFGLYYCLMGIIRFLLLLDRAEYAMDLPKGLPTLLNSNRDPPGGLRPFERRLLPRLECLQAVVVEELQPPTIAIDSFLAVTVRYDEARAVLRNIDGAANLSFTISELTGMLLSAGAWLLVLPFFAAFPVGFLAVPFLIWDSDSGHVLLYFLGLLSGLSLLFLLLPLTLWTLPHIRKLGFFGERLTDYLVTHISVEERPQTTEICLAGYQVTAQEGTPTSMLKHSSIYDDAAVLDDLAEWLWRGRDPQRCSSFVRDRRYRYKVGANERRLLTSVSMTPESPELITWRRARRIVAVPRAGLYFYPAFQFDASGQPLPIVAQVLSLFPEGSERTEWQNTIWFASSNDLLEGQSPKDILQTAPDKVLLAARCDPAHRHRVPS